MLSRKRSERLTATAAMQWLVEAEMLRNGSPTFGWRPAPRVKITMAGAVRALQWLVEAEMLRIAYGGIPVV